MTIDLGDESQPRDASQSFGLAALVCVPASAIGFSLLGASLGPWSVQSASVGRFFGLLEAAPRIRCFLREIVYEHI